MAGVRKHVSAATEAALWALSNGRCYAPGCPSPVVSEVRPGVYRKNAQIAHIRGVRAPRHDKSLTPGQCAEFRNLLILCLPHHGEVDDRKTGEKFYPVELLTRWKTSHEGSSGPALAALGPVDEDNLTDLLVSVFTPPAERLQQIADQLEQTGTLNAETVVQLRQVVDVMTSAPAGPSTRTAEALTYAADVFGTHAFRRAASQLVTAADMLTSSDKTLAAKVAQLQQAADLMSAAADRLRRYGPR